MGIAYNTSIVRDGLVFYVDAANPKSYPGSGATWFDLSGKGYNVTLFNSPVFSNKSLQFRAASSTYGIATFNENVLKQANEDGEWSIEAFFKQISPSSTNECMVAGRAGCHGGIYIYNDNTLKHAIKTTDCWTGGVNTTVVTMVNGEYYHTTMVYKNGIIYHYVNGQQIGSTVFDKTTYNMADYSDIFFIGGIPPGWFPNIDLIFVKCFNRALNSKEVVKNFEAVRGRI